MTKLKKEKRNDEGKSEAEAPTKKTNTTNKNTEKLTRTMIKQKLKYLLHKKSSIIKMIESDLLSRRGKARNIKQLSLSS